MTDSPSPRAPRAVAWVVGLAAVMTGLNAAKPIHMDDAVYHMYAAQIAAHPGDPYGGEVVDYWFPPKAGMDVLAPVFLPYYWSRALAVHGEDIVLAKLWLAPFPLLLVGASWALGRRFARGYEAIFAALVACSPAILPGQNVMLDVPALALGLAGLALFMRGCDRGSWRLAIASGLLAGAAINTKWTGLLAPAAMGLYALTHRRIGLGLAAIASAACVFGGWEAWIAHEYGRSHFLLHSERKGSPPLMDRINGARALVSILGGVAPAVLVTGLVAIGRPRWAAVAAAAAVAGIVGIALGLGPQAVFLPLGGLVLVNLGHVAFRLLRKGPSGRIPLWEAEAPAEPAEGPRLPLARQEPRPPDIGGDDLFLVLWLALEILGCFVLSPYSAVRRVLGIVVAATLLVVRLAARGDRGRSAARWAAAFGVGLGLFYFAIDYEEAVVERRAARDAAGRALALAGRGDGRWFAGRWGFRYHAEQAGLTPVVPGRDTFETGDVLAVVENKVVEEPRVAIDPADAQEIAALAYDAPRFVPPLRTVPTYYAGKNPLERLTGPRLVVRLYRINRPFTPLGLIPPWLGPKDRAVGAVMQIGKARR